MTGPRASCCTSVSVVRRERALRLNIIGSSDRGSRNCGLASGAGDRGLGLEHYEFV